ncbi:serine hydrolase domain-containing protein [Streptomyces sp. NPDC006879]|uniref:serine hydrolase domain-containing protein n=1 Tax=Streptomyces sp. NPDC006879 TaxID=3364767 RepID=UPI0036ABCDCD
MARSTFGLRRVAVCIAATQLLFTPLAAGTVLAQGAPARAAALAPSPSESEFPALTPAVAAQLDAAVRKVMAQADIPGVTVGLWAPGKGSYVSTFGVSDKDTGAPMNPGMYTRIGSETKTFTVTAVLELVDENKIGLDDPIGTYIDGVPGGDKITLRELAGMRSGLFNYSADPDFQQALSDNPRRHFPPQELLDYSFKHPVQFAPGTEFEYCNTNLILLGLLVEKVSGLPLGEFIERNILEPADLPHTVFPRGAEFPEPHPQGYTQLSPDQGIRNATNWNPSWGWAAGAMISDLTDMRSWARILATGTLLTPQTQAERLKTGPSNIPGSGYGLGIFNVQGWIGHNGSLPGYQTLVVYLPEAEATMVVFLNTDISFQGNEPSTLLGKAITEIVTPAHVFSLPAQPTT